MTKLRRHLTVLAEEDNDSLLKVAFATSDRVSVDQHFGSAKSFTIYGVGPDTARLLNVGEFGDLNEAGNEEKLPTKLAILEDCIAVYCRACGASAVRQLMSIGVQPVKVSEGATIASLIESLQQELISGPSTWLAQAIQRQRSPEMAKFDEMEAEGWSE